MVTPTISPMTTPYPDKGQTQVVFDTNVDGLMLLFDSLTTELPPALTWMQDRVDEVAATAMAGTLPDMTGKAGNYIRVNTGETAGELRTPAQVLLDIGSGTTGRAVFESESDAEAQGVLGLGTAATKSTGTATGNVVELDAIGLPPVNGSQLTGIVNPIKVWVNFNGTGTVAIRTSDNVSSITDNGAGDYTVNFTTALVDANYSAVVTAGEGGDGRCAVSFDGTTARTSSQFRFDVINHGNAARTDAAQVNVIVAR